MSDLKELTGLGEASVFESHVLSPPRLIEFAEAEEEAAAHYLRRVARSASALAPGAREVMYQRAVDNLRSNPFAYGSLGFDQWALSMSAAPFLTWLLLRIKHPKLTLGDSAQLLACEDYSGKVGAVWSLWGYKPSKKTPPPPASAGSAGNAGASAPSAGEPSSPRSSGPGPEASD
jgi:hypothetical protein